MADEPLTQQLTMLASLLAEVDARLARAPVAPVGLEELKRSVDQLRTSMWAILSAGHGLTAPVRIERLKLRRASEGLRSIQAEGAAQSRHPEHAELATVARDVAEQFAPSA